MLQDQIKEKQIEFRDKNLQLEEELEIERENGVKLTKVRAQRDSYQETIQRMQWEIDQFNEHKIELQNKNDIIKQLQKEITEIDEL
ncbi:MAG: hypothetical protein ACPHX8_08900 [Candidatus Poseidoniaceae archaeon]